MKALLLEPVGGHGGMVKYNQALLASIRLSDCNMELITSNDPNANRNYYNRAFGKANLLVRGLAFLLASLKSMLFAIKERISLVHLHFFHYGMKECFLVLLFRMFGLKVVATLHDVSSFSAKDRDRLKGVIFKLLSGIIVHSRQAEKEVRYNLAQLGIDVPVEHIVHGAHVEDVTLYSKHESRARLSIPTDKIVFLFIGQIKDVKGLDLLLEATALLSEEQKNEVLITVAGRPWKSDFSVYEKIIQEGNISELVDLRLKYIAEEDLDHYFSSADFVVLPYKKIYQSGVLLSALSYGKPVITSNLEAMCEVIKDQETAYTFEALSSKSLSAVMKACLSSDYDVCSGIGNAGLELMKNKYDWNNVGRQTVKFYKSINN